jgi:hypothetical protein
MANRRKRYSTDIAKTRNVQTLGTFVVSALNR